MEILKAFSRNVKIYRKNLHLSQEALAEKLNINTSNIVKIEAGNQFVSARVLFKLAEVLQVTVSDLFKEESPADTKSADSDKQKLLKYVSTLTDKEAKYTYEAVKLFQRYTDK